MSPGAGVRLAGCVLALTGCTATVLQTAGPAYEAQIVGSTPDALDLLGSDNRVYRIPRSDIRDIDHPGNVLMLIGGLTAAEGAMVGVAMAASKDADRSVGIAMGISYAVTGVALGLLGAVPYFKSKRAARAFEEASPGW